MALLVVVMKALLRQAIDSEAEARALRSELDDEGDLMPVVVDIDVMMARRKMSVGELAERIGITPTNPRRLEERSRRRRCASRRWMPSARCWSASPAICCAGSPTPADARSPAVPPAGLRIGGSAQHELDRRDVAATSRTRSVFSPATPPNVPGFTKLRSDQTLFERSFPTPLSSIRSILPTSWSLKLTLS